MQFQNKSQILNYLWFRILIPFLSEETCPYSYLNLCKLLEQGPDLGTYAFIFILALIPAFITLRLGWLLQE